MPNYGKNPDPEFLIVKYLDDPPSDMKLLYRYNADNWPEESAFFADCMIQEWDWIPII